MFLVSLLGCNGGDDTDSSASTTGGTDTNQGTDNNQGDDTQGGNDQGTGTSSNWQILNEALKITKPFDHSFTKYGNKFYVAFGDRDNEQKVTVMMLENGSWSTVGTAGFSDNASQDVTLTIDPMTGLPYVAFQLNCPSCLLTNFHGSVMGFNGTGWYYLGDPGFTQSQTYAFSLAVYDNHEFLVYTPNSAYFAYPTLMQYDSGQGQWSTLGELFLDDYILAYPDRTDLVYDDQVLYLAFRTSDKLISVVAQDLNPASISLVGNSGFSTAAQSFTDLEIDGGQLYVAYVEDGSNSIKVMMFDGTSWKDLGTTGSTALNNVELIVQNGKPYVAFIDLNQQVNVIAYDGSQWQSLDASSLITTAQLMPGPGLFADSSMLYLMYLEDDPQSQNTTYGGAKVVIKQYPLP